MWGELEFNSGHLADKQRLRPPHGPITPYRNLLNNRLSWILDPINILHNKKKDFWGLSSRYIGQRTFTDVDNWKLMRMGLHPHI